MGAAGAERRRRVRRGTIWHALTSPDSFGSVLVLILVSYMLIVTIESSWAKSLVLVVQIATVSLILRVTQAHRIVRIIAAVAFVLALVVAVTNLVVADSPTLRGILFGTAALLYLIAPLSILRALVARGQIDVETLFGAVDIYLLIGLFFAFTYQAIGALQGGNFFGAAGDGRCPRTCSSASRRSRRPGTVTWSRRRIPVRRSPCWRC